MCRVEGLYVRNQALDDKINNKEVKCSKSTCKWKGALKFLGSHQHTTYTDFISTSTSVTAAAKTPELPALGNSGNSVTSRPQSRSRIRAPMSSQNSAVSNPQNNSGARNSNAAQRQPLGNSSVNNNNTNPSTARSSSQRSNGTSNTTRSRTRSRVRNPQSPQRRTTNSSTGLPNGRLTTRARIRNGGNDSSTRATSNQTVSTRDENSDPTEHTTTEPIREPHPPPTSRPTVHVRRLPTLPGLVGVNSVSRVSESQNDSNIDTNNNVSQTTPRSEHSQDTPRVFGTTEPYVRRSSQRTFGMIRERLNQSRQRLDTLMNAFSSELDRGRQDLTDFQTEREIRRQEQMAEVRDLGRRLTQVAAELRGLLSQRRQIGRQIDNLVDAAADDTE